MCEGMSGFEVQFVVSALKEITNEIGCSTKAEQSEHALVTESMRVMRDDGYHASS